ncbi:MAG: ATP-binding protein [Sulfuricurvum sp.]
MKVDIEKAVKNIKGTIDFYRPLYEAIVNSFQAKATDINLQFDIEKKDHHDYIVGYAITDNGEGFTDENIDSFLTLWSTHNEDKGALGSGRIICLKVFNNILIESFVKDHKVEIDFNKKFKFNQVGEISKTPISNSANAQNKTTTRYVNITDEYVVEKRMFILEELKNKIFIELLPLFLKLHDDKNTFSIKINSILWIDQNSLKTQFESYDFKHIDFEIKSSIKEDENSFNFRLTYNILKDKKNHISQFYGASGRRVTDFPTKSKIKRLPDDASAIFCLSSKYLDDRVDDSREKFIITFNENNPTSENPLIFQDINKELVIQINKILKANFDTIENELSNEKQLAIEEYPYLASYIRNINQLAIKKNDIVAIAEKQFQKKFEDTKKSIVNFTKNIINKKHFSKESYLKITQDFTEVGQEQLAHYIAYRQTIIEMLFHVNECNMDKDKESFNEDYIHNLIMPQKKIKFGNKHIITENNFWLFDDKFMSYAYSASDQEIESILKSLSLEMDDETKDYFGLDRPDILMLYSNEINENKDVVIVELKKINIGSYDRSKAIDQLNIYASAIKENIPNVNDVFVYAVFEFDHKLEKILLNRGFHPKAFSKDGHNVSSYYMYNPNNFAHVHALSFEHLISDANSRNKLFLKILRNEITD